MGVDLRAHNEIEVTEWGELLPSLRLPVFTSHLHWLIQAFRARGENGDLLDCATLDLVASTEAAALGRAQALLPGRLYRVTQVVEHTPNLEALKES